MPDPRWKVIHDSLSTQIGAGRWRVGEALPTEVQIAAEWGVSRLTANRALNELAREGIVARKRKAGTVVAAPEAKAQAKTVSVILFDAAESLQASLLSHARRHLPDEVSLIYRPSDQIPQREAKLLRQSIKDSQGVILFPTCSLENNAALSDLASRKVPVVCVDRHPEPLPGDAVGTDNTLAAKTAIERLIAKGHTRIAHFTDHEFTISSVKDRFNGYRDAMIQAGLYDPSLVRLFPFLAPRNDREFGQLIQMVQDAWVALSHGPRGATAVLCLRDHTLGATLIAMERIGQRLGVDVELAGFMDRPPWLSPAPDRIWRIQQDTEEIARAAADRLVKRMAGDGSPPRKILVPALIHEPER